jgi:hypothetical protein
MGSVPASLPLNFPRGTPCPGPDRTPGRLVTLIRPVPDLVGALASSTLVGLLLAPPAAMHLSAPLLHLAGGLTGGLRRCDLLSPAP